MEPIVALQDTWAFASGLAAFAIEYITAILGRAYSEEVSTDSAVVAAVAVTAIVAIGSYIASASAAFVAVAATRSTMKAPCLASQGSCCLGCSRHPQLRQMELRNLLGSSAAIVAAACLACSIKEFGLGPDCTLVTVATTALPTLADPFDLLIVAAIAKIDFGVVAALLKGSPSVVRVYLHRCCENRVRA